MWGGESGGGGGQAGREAVGVLRCGTHPHHLAGGVGESRADDPRGGAGLAEQECLDPRAVGSPPKPGTTPTTGSACACSAANKSRLTPPRQERAMRAKPRESK